MGWGIGISIGWPNANAQATTNGYFQILNNCEDKPYINTYSQSLSATMYAEGNYVYGSEPNQRVLLGPFVNTLPDPYNTITLSGPAYISCPVLNKFYIVEFCGVIPPGGGTQLIDSTYYSEGDYVFCIDTGQRVRLGAIAPPETVFPYTYQVIGPVFNSCEV